MSSPTNSKSNEQEFWEEAGRLMDEVTRNGTVNRLINNLETITYYKHHYVRKTGLKKLIKSLLQQTALEAKIEALQDLAQYKYLADVPKAEQNDTNDIHNAVTWLTIDTQIHHLKRTLNTTKGKDDE